MEEGAQKKESKEKGQQKRTKGTFKGALGDVVDDGGRGGSGGTTMKYDKTWMCTYSTNVLLLHFTTMDLLILIEHSAHNIGHTFNGDIRSLYKTDKTH